MSIKIDENTFQDNNLSKAWAKAFLYRLNHNKSKPFTPLIAQITDIEDGKIKTDDRIHDLVNDHLEEGQKIETVANTIFPVSLWNKNRSRQLLFDRFNKCWPVVNKCKVKNKQRNAKGIYFRRFIAYGEDQQNGNQIEKILNYWDKNGRRRSAFQLTVFDPKTDHIETPYLPFPCLHQVSINPLGQHGNDGLSIIGYYANQYIFKKAYGNYLGLCRLGKFMAHEMGLELKEVTCIAARGNYDADSLTGSVLDSFKSELKDYLNG